MTEAPVRQVRDIATVGVAIPTFRRIERLNSLLRGIAAQTACADCSITVIVIDNDDHPSAREIVAAHAGAFPFALQYVHFPTPGLSAVRNYALARARTEFAFLAMIDDDEYPETRWLAELMHVMTATDADAVVGPVPQDIPSTTPRWLRAESFLALPTYDDGARISTGYSGNCLLRTAALERFGITFDTGLNFAGGEDFVFFKRLVNAGGNVRFAARASALEWIGAERLRPQYFLKLNLRRGNTLALSDRLVYGTRRALTMRALKASARMATGIASIVPSALIAGRSGILHALCNVLHGAGGLLGLFGYVYESYGRGDGVRS